MTDLICIIHETTDSYSTFFFCFLTLNYQTEYVFSVFGLWQMLIASADDEIEDRTKSLHKNSLVG